MKLAAGTSRRVTLEDRSVLPGFPGLPGWAAVVLLLVFVGVSWALSWGEELLGRPFTILFFLGAVLAVLLVRRRNVFTAVVQPPLVALVTIPLFQYFNTGGFGSEIGRTEILTILVPLAKRFPLLLATCLVVLAIALVRTLILEPRTHRSRSGGARQKPRSGGKHGASRPATDRRRAEPTKISGSKGAGAHAARGPDSDGEKDSDREPLDDAGDSAPPRRRGMSAAEAARKSASGRPPIRRVPRSEGDSAAPERPAREPGSGTGRHEAED